MTLEAIQREVVTLNEEERLRLSAFLMRIQRVDSEENKAELSRLNRQIDEGKYFTLKQLEEELRVRAQAEKQ